MLCVPPAGRAADLERINRTGFVAGGTQPGESVAGRGALSDDGRYLTFHSFATAVVPGVLDLNGREDVFVKDLQLGATRLVSRAAGLPNRAAAGYSGDEKISANGRYLVFASSASDLVLGFAPHFNGLSTAYWHDLELGLTRLIAHAAGQPAVDLGASSFNLEISGDGRYVLFASGANASLLVPGSTDGNNAFDLFLWDSLADTYQLVSHVAGNPLQAVPTDVHASYPRFSADGSTVAFASENGSLVAGDTLGFPDVFLFDRASGEIRLASHAAGAPGTPGNEFSSEVCDLSPSGRFLLFTSWASNLDAGVTDANGTVDLFLFDRDSGGIELVSRVPAPATAAANQGGYCGTLAADAGRIFFRSSSTDLVAGVTDNGAVDFFVRDRQAGTTRLITHPYWTATASTGGASSSSAMATADGGAFVFSTTSTNLYPILHDGPAPWTFRYEPDLDQLTPALVEVSPPPSTIGSELADLSADGSASVYETLRAGAVTGAAGIDRDHPLLVEKLESAGQARLVAPAAYAGQGTATFGYSSLDPVLVAGDGSKVVFSAGSAEICGATAFTAVCLLDRTTGAFRDINHRRSDPAISSGASLELLDISAQTGRYLLVQSLASNQAVIDANSTWDLFLYDTASRTFDLVSRSSGSTSTTADASSYQERFERPQAMSADANQVAFESLASNLVAGVQDANGQTDIYLRDRQNGWMRLVSRQPNQPLLAANGESERPMVAALGGYVAFVSAAGNLVPGFADGNGTDWDLYLFDVAAGANTLVSHAAGAPAQGANGDARYEIPFLSATGRFLVYTSDSDNLVAGASDTNGARDVIRYDRATGLNTLVSHAAGQPLVAANGTSAVSDVSSDGRFILFASTAGNLMPGQTANFSRLFLWDAGDGSLRLVSHQNGNPTVAVQSGDAELSPDNRRVFWATVASDVIPGADTNGKRDIYMWDRDSDRIELLTARFGNSGATGQGDCELVGRGRALDDGQGILFKCFAADLLPHDSSFSSDLFLALAPAPLFADGFESGATLAWSATLP